MRGIGNGGKTFEELAGDTGRLDAYPYTPNAFAMVEVPHDYWSPGAWDIAQNEARFFPIVIPRPMTVDAFVFPHIVVPTNVGDVYSFRLYNNEFPWVGPCTPLHNEVLFTSVNGNHQVLDPMKILPFPTVKLGKGIVWVGVLGKVAVGPAYYQLKIYNSPGICCAASGTIGVPGGNLGGLCRFRIDHANFLSTYVNPYPAGLSVELDEVALIALRVSSG